MRLAFHVTPKENIDSILKKGILAFSPEEDGDLAISLFKTKDDAIIQTEKWLKKKFNKKLILLTINIENIVLTETFPFELITTEIFVIPPERIIKIEDFG